MKPDETEQANDQEQLPRPVEMDDQGPTYSSSYNETEPGQVTANRRNALQGDAEEDSLGIDEAGE